MVEVDTSQSDMVEPETTWTDYMNSYVANEESIGDIPATDMYQPLPTYLKR